MSNSSEVQRIAAVRKLTSELYAIRSRETLINDFTHFLDDPVNGDQEEQDEGRTTLGGQGTYSRAIRIGPIPTDTTLGFGYNQALVFANGALRPFWASNFDAVNGQLLTIATASATYPAGPRVIASTMGPVKSTTVDGFTFNDTKSLDPKQGGCASLLGATGQCDR